MVRMKVQQGELAHWLRLIDEHGATGMPAADVPLHLAEALTILRCIRDTEQGTLVLTDKGQLALRMESSGAIHFG